MPIVYMFHVYTAGTVSVCAWVVIVPHRAPETYFPPTTRILVLAVCTADFATYIPCVRPSDLFFCCVHLVYVCSSNFPIIAFPDGSISSSSAGSDFSRRLIYGVQRPIGLTIAHHHPISNYCFSRDIEAPVDSEV